MACDVRNGSPERILGIDPGTSCGWALGDDSGRILSSGTWDLGAKRFEGGGMRFLRLRRFLDELEGVGLVAVEEVRRHLGTAAAHVYGGILATVQTWCEEREIPYTGVPVSTVKKTATGKGNAGKQAVLAAARNLWPERDVTEEDEADALWVYETARRSL